MVIKKTLRAASIHHTCSFILMLLLFAATAGSAGAAPTNIWTANGPFSSVINSIAITSQTVIAGTNGGGIYLSANNGTTWTASSSNISSSTVVNTVVANGANIYAATAGSGIFVSTNDGTTWSATNNQLPANSNVTSIAVNGADLYIGIKGGGVYKSSNGGTNWSPLNGGSGQALTSVNIKAVAVIPTAGSPTLLAGTTGAGLFISSNDGADWSEAAGLPAGTTVNSLALDLSTTPATVYAGTAGSAVYKSTNGGQNWSLPANAGLSATAAVNGLVIRLSRVYAQTDGGFFRTDDGGANWTTPSNAPVVSNFNCLAIDPITPARMYLGTSGGVFLSTDSGATWAASGAGLSYATDVRATAVDPGNTSVIYAGGSGSGAFKSSDGGENWSIANKGLGNASVNTLLPLATTIYAGTSNGVFKSTDGAVNWSAVNTGLTSVEVRTLAYDPQGQNLYAGTSNGVYKSAEGAINWSAAGISSLNVKSMAVDSSTTPVTIYAGTAGSGVYRSTNDGGSWSQVSGLVNTVINGMALDSATPAKLCAATAGGLFRLAPPATTWTSIASGFSTTDIKSVAVASSDPLYILAGTNSGGLYLSSNGAGSWLALNSGLPSQPVVQAIAVDSGSPKKLYIGLAGEGSAALTISPTISTGNVTSLNYGTIFTGATSAQTITMTNTGSIPLTVSSFTLSDSGSSMFDYSPGGGAPCAGIPVTILPGQNCTMDITFRPTSTGPKSATLSIAANDVITPVTSISLQGNAISLSAAITSPANGAYLYGPTATISGTAAASGTALSKVEVSISGAAWTTASGTSTWSLNWSLPADGIYTIQARAVDTANFNSTPDCTNHPAPFDCITVVTNNVLPTSAITLPVNNAKLTGGNQVISGTASDIGAGVKLVEVSTDGGTTTWTTATGTAAWSLTWTPPGSGAYIIKSRATDNDNKVQTTLPTINVTVDASPPATTISSPADGAFINGTSYTIRGTASDLGGSGLNAIQISLDGEATWVAASGQSPWTYAWTIPSNTYNIFTIKSRASDVAGNLEAVPQAVTVTVDNIPPTATINAPPQFVSGTSYTFSGTASDTGAGIQKVEVSINGSLWTDATGTSNWTYDWPLPADGSYTMLVRAMDLAGNVQATPATVTVTVNNLPPTATILQPADNAAINTTSYVITGTADDSGAGVQKVEISIDSGAWTPVIFNAVSRTWSYNWTIPPPVQEKRYTILARVTDNESSTFTTPPITVIVDTTAPVSAITSPLSGALINGTTFTITGTSLDTLTASGQVSGIQGVQVSLDGGTTWTAASSLTENWSNWAFEWTLPTTAQQLTIKSRAIDRAGNVQILPASAAVEVYQLPPTSTITAPAAGARLRGTSYTIAGTATDLGLGIARIEVSSDGGATWNPADGATSWTYTWQLPADGVYSLISKATNIVGYVQSSFTPVSVTVDNTVPDTTISAKPLFYSNTASPAFAFAANEASTFECKVDEASFASCASPAIYPGLAEGSHSFSVRAIDLAGNVDPTPSTYNWIVDTIKPQTTGNNPANSTSRISVTSEVKVTFSEAMDPATITTSTFTLDNGAAGTVTYDQATRTATFSATPRLAYATTYTATVSAGAKDLAANPLAAPLVWTFATDPDGDIDLSGTVDIADAVLCLQSAVTGGGLTPQQLRHGNVAPMKDGKPNPNSNLDVGDAVVILERVVGIVSW